MKVNNPIVGERCRVEYRLAGASGLAGALQAMSHRHTTLTALDVQAVADALAFHLDQLCREFDFSPETRGYVPS